MINELTARLTAQTPAVRIVHLLCAKYNEASKYSGEISIATQILIALLNEVNCGFIAKKRLRLDEIHRSYSLVPVISGIKRRFDDSGYQY
ncbi:protein of unknown function [Kyrpidia spormannii]|uniref:Uncharacterized protein n=1 Tax=Kyrpidia spormannii TaxID=2055160 RepID=A0A6F9ECE0_9BACL|nr:protein of unknown function [Kyrpidia spormannii]